MQCITHELIHNTGASLYLSLSLSKHMDTPAIQSCRSKTRKRKPTMFGFQNFGTPESTAAMDFSGPFRKNIRCFLREFGELEDYTIGGNPLWCTLLVSENNGAVFPLYTIEETVRYSSHSFCDHCRYVGWSHHFVSKRRYHLIIPVDDDWNKRLKKDTLELYTHLLHCVIHCNGFGHLLCINGLQEGPNYLSSDEIMNLFDRICTSLGTRKITVRDLSIKGSMDLRLLHSVAYGQPWFGKWGYKFCNGSFGVTEKIYNRAIEILSSLELDKIMNDFADQGEEIDKIIYSYRDASDTQLVTISDLLSFMLAFKSKAPIQKKTTMTSNTLSSNHSKRTTHQQKTRIQQNQTKYETFVSFIAKLDSRWPARRLKYVAEVIVDVLRENSASGNGKGGMLRQELRDAVRNHIGDTGLIDFVLKSMGNSDGEDQIVCRTRRPVTGLLEFSIYDDVNGGKFKKGKTEAPPLSSEPGLDVYQDVLYLYRQVLLGGYPESDPVSLATRVVLDSKQFVKEWMFNDECGDKSMRLICRVLPSYEELVSELTRPLPPGELVVVPRRTTVSELKLMAQCALRDTYCIMDQFTVKQIGGLKGRDEEDVLTWAGELGTQVWLRGCGLDLDTELRYEGGPSDWTVDCVCGAKDDDGERMVACDVCHVWQHTRCCSIDDDEDAPRRFVCPGCNLK